MQKPIIFQPGSFTKASLDEFRSTHKIWQVVDVYNQQLAELFEVKCPDKQADKKAKEEFFRRHEEGELAGAWVYYPWSGVLLHCVNEKNLFALRTNRNKNIITAEEQQKLSNTCVAVCGMSVGNSIALTLAHSGIANNMKLTDFDDLETANLNRLRTNLTKLGQSKISITAQQLWELDPFAQLSLYESGVDDNNIDQFFNGPTPKVVFDAIDDFPMKVKLRLKARELGVAVVMLTSLGDNVLIDVERYDLYPSAPLFNGLIGSTPEDILNGDIGEREKVKYAIDLVDAKHIPTSALGSLFEINRTLVGRPQLASTVAIDGGLAAFLVRQIVLGKGLDSGRHYLSLEKAVGLHTIERKDKRDGILEKLDQLIGR